MQYGIKFTTTVFKIEIENCKAIIPENVNDYYGAYFILPDTCNAKSIMN